MKSWSFILLAFLSIQAQNPRQWISLQGLLLKPTGQHVTDGKYPACFRIFSSVTGGTAQWEECDSVAVVDGYYQTQLGDQKSLPLSNGKAAYVELEVNGEIMSGRVSLTGAAGAWTSYAATDTVWDGARLGEGVAVRSINGLRDDITLQTAGNLALQVRGDTLHLEGQEAFDSVQQARLDSATLHARSPHIMFSGDSAKARAERMADSTRDGLLSAADFKSFKAKGNMHADSLHTIKFVVHQRGDGWTYPTCSAATEGLLRYETNYWVNGSGTLMLCMYAGSISRYSWLAIVPAQ